ncbi:MAG: DUF86 domain-containing protein [Promethearchaeota archaeon]|nr:MAG: DUF86 domain-containing protein [Candidatus Lokiarchaeota archaeon]
MIKAKLVIIDENIKLVRDNLPLKLQDFKDLGLVKDGIYKRIEASIQEVLSVCSIINADLKLGIPSNREDIIDALKNEKVISNELSNKIKGLKGFRNFLVHRYGKLNDDRAFEDITKGLSDFRKFKEEILSYIKMFEAQEKLQKDEKN